MKQLIFILILCLTSCTTRQEPIDFQQVLDAAATRANQAKSLSENTLLTQALEYYQTLEPKDSARLSQATILTAYHYWWKGEKSKAYDLLKSIADTNKEALECLLDLASKDNDFEACYEYLKLLRKMDTENEFWIHQTWATLHFYLNQPVECECLFDNITQYIRTPEDSALYWSRVLPNHADIISDYGKQAKAIELQEQVLNHFIGKDSSKVASAHASLARYYLLQDKFKEAALRVTKRPITVRVLSDSFRYDGKPHTAMEVRLDTTSPYTLATSRHTLKIKDTDLLLFTDAGTYINDPTVSVYDARAGVYVTENYEITRYEGTVTIEKRPLHIQLNGEKMYDGKPMDESDYRIDFLNGTSPASGHTVKAQPTEIHYGSAYTKSCSIEQSTLTVKDQYGTNVRKNYDVHFYTGSLTVTRRPISLVTASAEKVYDGTPLVDYGVMLAPGSLPLVNGDEATMVVSGSQTEVGQSNNTALADTFVICDILGQDATENYELVSVTEGTLTVKYGTVITVTTGSAEKPFDGLPLYARDYAVETTGDPLPEGYAVFADVTGLITRPGSTPNTATVTVRDGEGNDVTHLFTVELRTGVLTVTDELSDGAAFGRVYSDRSGRVYLRMASYGDYNGQGWNTAAPYGTTLPGGYTPNLLPAAALKTLGLTATATLRFSGMKIFMLPYYTEINSSNPTVGSDTDYTATLRDSYNVTYYPVEDTLLLLEQFHKLPAYLRPMVLGNYASAEKSYRAFVKQNYLTPIFIN